MKGRHGNTILNSALGDSASGESMLDTLVLAGAKLRRAGSLPVASGGSERLHLLYCILRHHCRPEQ